MLRDLLFKFWFWRRRVGSMGFLGVIAMLGSNTPLLAAFGSMEIVELKWLSLRNLSAAGGQRLLVFLVITFVNRSRPTKKIPRLLAAGSFIFGMEGGVSVFSGTRVPVHNLIDSLEAGDSIDLFLYDFPSVDRKQVLAFLEMTKERLLASAKNEGSSR